MVYAFSLIMNVGTIPPPELTLPFCNESRVKAECTLPLTQGIEINELFGKFYTSVIFERGNTSRGGHRSCQDNPVRQRATQGCFRRFSSAFQPMVIPWPHSRHLALAPGVRVFPDMFDQIYLRSEVSTFFSPNQARPGYMFANRLLLFAGEPPARRCVRQTATSCFLMNTSSGNCFHANCAGHDRHRAVPGTDCMIGRILC